MTAYALFRMYPNGVQARITPRGKAFVLEIYDRRGRRKPDLPVIASTLDDAKRIADEHAGVPSKDPWMPVYPGTFKVVLPDELTR